MTIPSDAPPALAQVAQRYAQSTRGVVTARLHRVFDVHGGFSRRHEDLMMNALYDNGNLVRVRVSSYAINGRAASASDIASVEQSWNHPNPNEVFAPPYDPRHLREYDYQRGGPSTINFTSNVRDAGHGHGSFTYDAAGDVVSITYQPNVLPQHATAGQITDQHAEVLMGYWAVSQETQNYRGTYGPFAAAGTITVTYSDFKRFRNVESALQAL
jgi:hypothetical protein